MVRTCRYCRAVLVEFPRRGGQGEQHCASPSCRWCMTCVRAVYARNRGS